jgi:hypothetical protein
MKSRLLPALALSVALVGCATVPDGNGGTRTELTDGGRAVVGILFAAILVGGLAALSDDGDRPTSSLVTTYPDGSQSRTDYYYNR